ncbi:MAG TPA: phosphotransferase family protein [Solirubrobacteraceae bacterium]|nr:phosphotransferase family protein [Solirubrobacteraceae bacterium]
MTDPLARSSLQHYLDGLGLGSGALEVTPFSQGHSNLTYLIQREGLEVVLRRPPLGPLPPSSHDVLREARLVAALAGSGVRCPDIVDMCADPDVIGAPFYLMSRVEGRVLAESATAAFLPVEHRREAVIDLVEALVEIHAVPWRGGALETIGRPTGYLARQVRRFTELLDVNATRPLPALQRVAGWLAENAPQQRETTLVHGDFRIGNVIYGPGAPSVAAVVDWELATLGDPLADLGYLQATYAEVEDDEDPMLALSGVTAAEGFPTPAEVAALYEQRSGRPVDELRWYTVLAVWKSAVFLEGSYKRYLSGTTDDAYFARLETGVPYLARRAEALADDRELTAT